MTVGLVLIPQALAYATLAGMPPITGLYAALIPGLIGVLWGSSSLLATGPVALTSILVFGSLSSIAEPGSTRWITMAIWLAMYSGLIQLLLGLFKTGKVTYLVSQPVTTGFINAAAIIIIFAQLPALLGMGLHIRDWANNGSPLFSVQPGWEITALFGGIALVALFSLRHFLPKFPAMLGVTALAIFLSWAIDYAGYGGATVGALPRGLPSLALPPSISFSDHRGLWAPALILAIISFTEAMSSCRVIARKRNETWNENQELVGQGLAKLASGLSAAFPVSGSLSRSALNLYAGATSSWSSLFSVGCVLICLLFLTDLLAFLPYSVLAATIIVPVLTLIKPRTFYYFFKISFDDGLAALVTFAVTLLFSPNLHFGVFAGIGLTMTSYIYRRIHPRIIEVGKHTDGTLRDIRRFNLPPLAADVLAVRIDAALNFLTAATLERFIADRRSANPSIRRILVCAGSINDIDASGVEALQALHQHLQQGNVELYLSTVKHQVWLILDRTGLLQEFDSKRIFATDHQAIEQLSHDSALQC